MNITSRKFKFVYETSNNMILQKFASPFFKYIPVYSFKILKENYIIKIFRTKLQPYNKKVKRAMKQIKYST